MISLEAEDLAIRFLHGYTAVPVWKGISDILNLWLFSVSFWKRGMKCSNRYWSLVASSVHSDWAAQLASLYCFVNVLFRRYLLLDLQQRWHAGLHVPLLAIFAFWYVSCGFIFLACVPFLSWQVLVLEKLEKELCSSQF